MMKTIKKIFALVLLLTISSLAFEVKAQQLHLNVYDSSNCDFNIVIYDNLSNPLYSTTVFPGSNIVTCFNVGAIDYLTIEDAGTTCSLLTFGSSGLFPYTSLSPTCGVPACTQSIDCSGGTPSICGPGDYYLLIRIRP